MATRMTEKEAGDNFSELLSAVESSNVPVIVERKGRPVAVVISLEQYEQYDRLSREELARLVQELRQRNEDKDPDGVYRDVKAVVDEVRRERYEREHPAG